MKNIYLIVFEFLKNKVIIKNEIKKEKIMSNPVINRLDEYQRLENDSNTVMTVSGTMTSFFILSLLLLLPAAITWNWAALHYMDRVYAMTTIGAVVGFILAIVLAFVPKLAPFLAPLYAVCEGMLVGGLSAVFEMQLPGIVVQAVSANITKQTANVALTA